MRDVAIGVTLGLLIGSGAAQAVEIWTWKTGGELQGKESGSTTDKMFVMGYVQGVNDSVNTLMDDYSQSDIHRISDCISAHSRHDAASLKDWVVYTVLPKARNINANAASIVAAHACD